MSNETPRTMSMRYVLHGQDNDSVLDSESGIIIECGYNEDAELLRDQLNGYEERLDATRAKLAECEQKAESYDLTHTGDWFERAHALGQRDPAKYAGRDIWHVAVEMAESLAEVERERHREHEARVQMEHELSEAGCATVADLVRERDEARESVRYALNEGVPKLVATVKDGLDAIRATAEAKFAEYGRALAAAQAEVVALREALEGVVVAHPQAQRVDEHDAWMLGAARRLLSRAPGSLDALRALGEKVAFATKERGDEYERRYRLTGVPFNSADAQEIVARLLGEKDGAR